MPLASRSTFRWVACLAAAALLAGCGGQEEPAQPAERAAAGGAEPLVVKIGHAAPLTGPVAHLGKDNENGTRLAIDEANAANPVIGGRPVRFEMLSEDDQADPKQATIVAQKLADANVAGVVGHLNSGTTIPASKIYSDAGIPQISPSATNVKYTHQGFRTAFRVMANDAQQGKVLGQYAVEKLGAKNIAVIDDKTAYGAGLADEFVAGAQAAGATIVTREYTNDKATDFTAILTKIKGRKPDLIFYGGMDTQAGPMMKQVKTLGISAPVLAGDGCRTPEFIKLGGTATEGAMASTPGVPLEQMPGGPAFAEKFTGKYGELQLYAPYAYDAFNVMLSAMKAADSTDPERYLPVLAGIEHEGVTARIAFDENGDLKGGAISMYRVKDGKWEFIETLGR
jgi:branched-chain amino acid transport system substrate-binding protein